MNTQDSKSPSLDLISHDLMPKGYERRRLPRLTLTSEQFRLSKNNKVFSVCDISQQGMGLLLLDRADLDLFSVGAEIEGHLNLNREKYLVKARIRNISLERIGCEFESFPADAKKALDHLLNPEVLGRELKPIPSPGKNMLWYHGRSGTDLVLKRKTDGQYQGIILYVLGHFIQWDEETGLSTGRTLPSKLRDEVRGIMRLETLFLESDTTCDPLKLKIAKTVILSSNLPQDLKSWCIRKME